MGRISELHQISSCRLKVIGKLSTMNGKTVTVTNNNGYIQTLVFGSSIEVTFDYLLPRQKYTVSCEGFSKTITFGTGEYKELELGEFDRLWLYRNGNMFLDDTKGFYRSGDGLMALRTAAEIDAWGTRTNTTNAGGLYTGKQIDVTEYNTLWVDMWSHPSFSIQSIIGLATSQTMGSGNWSKVLSNEFGYLNGTVMLPLYISDYYGLYYIIAYGGNGTNGYVGFNNLYLSKDKCKQLIPYSGTAAFPGGVVTASSTYSGYDIKYILHNQDTKWVGGTGQTTTNSWLSAANSVTNQWVKVNFDTVKCANIARVDFNYARYCTTVIVSGSNDDVTYSELGTLTASAGSTVAFGPLNNVLSYKYYKYSFFGSNVTDYISVSGIQLYDYDNKDKAYKDLNK